METIKIKEIVKKPSGLVIVKHEGGEATMNTKWQAQEVDYFEKDVGVGGSVNCLIEKKGQYTNITEVDFGSAVKGTPQLQNKETGLMSVKDIQIISQCLTKAWARGSKSPQEVLEAYRFFVLELEQNG